MYVLRDYNYVWEEARNTTEIDEKVEYIKDNDSWEDVRNEYLKLKNRYLSFNSDNHPSYVCYIEAVNNVYNQIRYQSIRKDLELELSIAYNNDIFARVQPFNDFRRK